MELCCGLLEDAGAGRGHRLGAGLRLHPRVAECWREGIGGLWKALARFVIQLVRLLEGALPAHVWMPELEWYCQ